MSTYNGKTFTSVKNINLRGGAEGTGLIRWSPPALYSQNGNNWSANPFGTADYGLYISNTGALSYSAAGTVTTLTSGTVKTLTALGTTQNSTPTAAQLMGGIVTQTGATGAGTVTLPTGTQLSTAFPYVAVGSSFMCDFANLGGGQTLTITGQTGSTVIGTAAVGSGKNASMRFVNTGSNVWSVFTIVSA